MTINTATSDLFIGAVDSDTLVLIGEDEAMFGAEGTFAGAESDVLAWGGSIDHPIEIEDALPAGEEHDVLSTSADSDIVFDVADDRFEADDVDAIEGDVWELDIAA